VERQGVTRPARIGGGTRIVYGRSICLPAPRSAHDRFRNRVSRASLSPPALRSGDVPPLRAFGSERIIASNQNP
jgi:hypothetical protein